jgi:hypothetical protein
MVNVRNECLIESGTTNIILKIKRYFSQLSPAETHVNILFGISNFI